MPIPENTTERDPMIHLLGAMSDGPSRYIEDLEADGQRQLVASDKLPTDLRDRSEFEALGFTFGDPIEGDPMFAPATLPPGWKREGYDHAMWSYIVDERGIQRVGIFYKAAYYDRSAHASLINVGNALAAHFVYSDEPDISTLGLFTADERAAFVARLRSEAEEKQYASYGNLDRVRAWLAEHDELLADQAADAVSETAAARADATEWGDTK